MNVEKKVSKFIKCDAVDEVTSTTHSTFSRELFPPMSSYTSAEVVIDDKSSAEDKHKCGFLHADLKEQDDNRWNAEEENVPLSTISKEQNIISNSTTPALFIKCGSNRTNRCRGSSIASSTSAKYNLSSLKCFLHTPRQNGKTEQHRTLSTCHEVASAVKNTNTTIVRAPVSNNHDTTSFKIVVTDAAAQAEPPLESPLGKVISYRTMNATNQPCNVQHQEWRESKEQFHKWEDYLESNEHQHKEVITRNVPYSSQLRDEHYSLSELYSPYSNINNTNNNKNYINTNSNVSGRKSYSLPSTVLHLPSIVKSTYCSNKSPQSSHGLLPTMSYDNENDNVKIEGELWLINNNNDKNNIYNSGLLTFTPKPNQVKSMRLMPDRRQWVSCDGNRLLVYSSWSNSHGKLLAEMYFHRVHVLFQFTHSEHVASITNNGNNINNIISNRSSSSTKNKRNNYHHNKYESNKNAKQKGNICSRGNNTDLKHCCYYYYFGVEGLTHEETSSTNRRSLLIFCTDSLKAYSTWIRFWNEKTMRYPIITHLLTSSVRESMESPEPGIQRMSPAPFLWQEDDTWTYPANNKSNVINNNNNNNNNNSRENSKCENVCEFFPHRVDFFSNDHVHKANHDNVQLLTKVTMNGDNKETECDVDDNETKEANENNLVLESQNGEEKLKKEEGSEMRSTLETILCRSCEHCEQLYGEKENVVPANTNQRITEEETINDDRNNNTNVNSISLMLERLKNTEEVSRTQLYAEYTKSWLELVINWSIEQRQQEQQQQQQQVQNRSKRVLSLMQEKVLSELTTTIDKCSKAELMLNERLCNLSYLNTVFSNAVQKLITLFLESTENSIKNSSSSSSSNDNNNNNNDDNNSQQEQNVISSTNTFADKLREYFLLWNCALEHFCNNKNNSDRMCDTQTTIITGIDANDSNATSVYEMCSELLKWSYIDRTCVKELLTALMSTNFQEETETDTLCLELARNNELYKESFTNIINKIVREMCQKLREADRTSNHLLKIANMQELENTKRMSVFMAEEEDYRKYVNDMHQYNVTSNLQLRNKITILENALSEYEELAQTRSLQESRRCETSMQTVHNTQVNTHVQTEEGNYQSIQLEKRLKELLEENAKEHSQHIFFLERENAELRERINTLEATVIVENISAESAHTSHDKPYNSNSNNSCDNNLRLFHDLEILENIITAYERQFALTESVNAYNNNEQEKEEEEILARLQQGCKEHHQFDGICAEQEQNSELRLRTLLSRSMTITRKMQKVCERERRERSVNEELWQAKCKSEHLQRQAELLLDCKEQYLAAAFGNYKELINTLEKLYLEEIISDDKDKVDYSNTKYNALSAEINKLQCQLHIVERVKLVEEQKSKALECTLDECKENESLLESHITFLQREIDTLSTNLYSNTKSYQSKICNMQTALMEAEHKNALSEISYQSKLRQYELFVKSMSNLTSRLVAELDNSSSELSTSLLTKEQREHFLPNEEANRVVVCNNANEQNNFTNESTALEMRQCTENVTRVMTRIVEWNNMHAHIKAKLEKLHRFATCELSECVNEEIEVKKSKNELNEAKHEQELEMIASGNNTNSNVIALQSLIDDVYDAQEREVERKRNFNIALSKMQKKLSNLLSRIIHSEYNDDGECNTNDNNTVVEVQTNMESESISVTETKFSFIDKLLDRLEQQCSKVITRNQEFIKDVASKAMLQHEENNYNKEQEQQLEEQQEREEQLKEEAKEIPVEEGYMRCNSKVLSEQILNTKVEMQEINDRQMNKVNRTVPFTISAINDVANLSLDDEYRLIAEICYMRRLVHKKIADDELTTVQVKHLINMLYLCQAKQRRCRCREHKS